MTNDLPSDVLAPVPGEMPPMHVEATPRTAPQSLPNTLEALRASGWHSRSVTEELRENFITALASGETLLVCVLSGVPPTSTSYSLNSTVSGPVAGKSASSNSP